jgi:2-polyprenyl-3-methyl-5-hydroxy-6-metoxy-1,4-benzoquinol methylase
MSGFYRSIIRYYDAENRGKDDDITLYSQLASEYGDPILEIGCGTGRVMIPLAHQGYTVHGIDNEAAMIEQVQAYADTDATLKANMHLHYGDVITYALDKQFKLVLATYNLLMHFHEQDDQLAVLRKLHTWTADDGLLVIDLPNAGEVFATQETDAIMLDRTFLEPQTGHMVMQQSHSVLDRTTQLLQITWIYDEIIADGTLRRTTATHHLYYYFYAELALLLKLAGFEVEAVYGDTDYTPFVDGVERMIVFAHKV